MNLKDLSKSSKADPKVRVSIPIRDLMNLKALELRVFKEFQSVSIPIRDLMNLKYLLLKLV